MLLKDYVLPMMQLVCIIAYNLTRLQFLPLSGYETMNLCEYQAKKLFARYGIPAPIGYVCRTPAEAEEAACKIGCGPWVVKCQIHAGGRGKAGGINLADTKEEVSAFAASWLGKRLVTCQTDVLGHSVHQVLVEAVVNIDKELYLGVVIDISSLRVVFMASNEGGIEIEKVAQDCPELIHKVVIDPFFGPQLYQGRELAFKLGLIEQQVSQFTNIFMGLITLFLERDMTIVEINPLVISKHGDLVCLDGKMCIDSNALFRQPELRKMIYDPFQEDECESRAVQWGLSYVTLNGNIGCIVNGAGLAMGTIDILKLYGGEPANFMDIGGSASKERVAAAFKIILYDNKVKAVLVNIFGGIVCCNIIAEGIIDAVAEADFSIPIVVRMEGNNAEVSTKKLIGSRLNIIAATSLIDAVKQVVAVANNK